jgi:hypothetical protein
VSHEAAEVAGAVLTFWGPARAAKLEVGAGRYSAEAVEALEGGVASQAAKVKNFSSEQVRANQSLWKSGVIPVRSIEPRTSQLLLFNTEKRTVFSGHGSWSKLEDGFTKVPRGTTFTIYGYAKKGELIGNRLGNAIEINVDLSGVFSKTYTPGMRAPNLRLHPPGDLEILGNPRTVTEPTLLQDLLEPYMGACHWAACLERPLTWYFR